MKWLKGYLVCETKSSYWERFMNICRHHKILLWNISRDDTITFCMNWQDFKSIRSVSRKTHLRPRIVKKKGLPFCFSHIKKQGTFYSGILFFLVTLVIFSSYVWDIQYKGQRSFSKEMLEKTIYSLGVHPGLKRSQLDCNQLEKQIREIYPDISWVSAEEKGSLLCISIKEGKKSINNEETNTPVHRVSQYDGVIESITVNRGIAQVKKGETVKKGQVLISGIVPITDDSEGIVSKNAVSAKGTIVMKVEETIEIPISLKYQKKNYTGKEIIVYHWGIGSKKVSIKNPLKQFNNSCKYDIIKSICNENSICHDKVIYKEYKLVAATYTKKELKQVGNERYEKLLRETKEKGTIVSHSASLVKGTGDTWILKGKITYLTEQTGTKEITEKEMEIEDGTSGNDTGDTSGT